jgi:hypothetical protein
MLNLLFQRLTWIIGFTSQQVGIFCVICGLSLTISAIFDIKFLRNERNMKRLESLIGKKAARIVLAFLGISAMIIGFYFLSNP